MKKLYHTIGLVLISLLISCEGPQGRQGIPGADGLDGLDGLDGEEAYVFEYIFSFTSPEYSALLELPTDFEMLDSDVMLVYLLWEITDDNTEIWRALPQTLYLESGILSYNYDFTRFDAQVFMDGTVNLDGLGADFTDNWIARLVVVPSQFGGRTTLDYSNYDQMNEFYDFPPLEIQTEGYRKRPEMID